MPVWGWMLVGVALVVVVAIVGLLAVTRRRSVLLREQFGPEYERTVEAAGERRGAEAELRERRERREQFSITPCRQRPGRGIRRTGGWSNHSSWTIRRPPSGRLTG